MPRYHKKSDRSKKNERKFRGIAQTKSEPLRKGKAKLSTVGQRHTVESPTAFNPLLPSDSSPEGEDREHKSLTFTHTHNGKDKGQFEVQRRVSGDGIIVLPERTYLGPDGKVVKIYDNDNGVIERYTSYTKGYTISRDFICPLCGNTHILHDCKPDGKDHTPESPTNAIDDKPIPYTKPYTPEQMTTKPKGKWIYLDPERRQEIDQLLADDE